MDKQINLYANVFTGAERRRRQTVAAWGLGVAIAIATVGGYRSFRAERASLQAQSGAAVDGRSQEVRLVEAMRRELQERRAKAERARKDESAADAARLSTEGDPPRLLAASWNAVKGWSAPGAALRRASYEGGVLTIVGEARGAREAAGAMEALMGGVAAAGAWNLGRRDIKAPAAPDPHYEFKLTATPRAMP